MIDYIAMSHTPEVSSAAIPVSREEKMTRIHWLLLAGCVGLFLVMRLKWIGHILVWDEAATLCTMRAFKAGARDAFSEWFWRHPPLYSMLMLLVKPFELGFAERVELLTVGIATINQLILFYLNRRIFGISIALWSVFLIAVIPGSIFFDVWIKQDHPVTTFGLLAILLLFSGRTLYAGCCLGLALLSKETAVFYVAAAVLLWAAKACGRRTLKDFLALTLVPALACSWWYLIVLTKVAQMTHGTSSADDSFWSGFLRGDAFRSLQIATGSGSGWENHVLYYFTKLPVELSWLGLALTVIGLGIVVKFAITGRSFENVPQTIYQLWPPVVLLPALFLLSLTPNKAPWLVIVLFPAWASLSAIALHAGFSFVSSYISPGKIQNRILAGSVFALLIIAGTKPGLPRDYDSILRKLDEGQWLGAYFSREAAMGMNNLTKDGDRALITSFHYWEKIPHVPCPIFTYYLIRKINVLVRPHTRTFPDLVQDIRNYRLDWALVSPMSGPAADGMFKGFEHDLGLKPTRFPRAFLYHTTEVYQNSPMQKADPPTTLPSPVKANQH